MSEDLTRNLQGSQHDALAQILSAVQNLGTRLDSLEKKVEERLYDTRPIWEKVVEDIRQLQEGQTKLQTDVTQLQNNVTQLREGQDSLRREVNTGLRDINRKFSISNDTLTQMQADYRDIYDRVRDLERQRT
jgi:predicted RNase H-like nuclease (RuvC/YqgF family)